jgi:hypothetical protein
MGNLLMACKTMPVELPFMVKTFFSILMVHAQFFYSLAFAQLLDLFLVHVMCCAYNCFSPLDQAQFK